MKRIITALILIPLVLLLVFKAPLWAIALLCCFVALLAEYEFLHIAKGFGADPQYILPFALTCYVFIGGIASGLLPKDIYFNQSIEGIIHLGYLPPLFFGSVLMLAFALRKPDLRSSAIGAVFSLFAVFYIGLALVTLIGIRSYFDGVFWLVILFATVWAGDTAAMYIGKAFGKHKLAPSISPKKTWEGTIGSLIGSIIVSLLVLRFHDFIFQASRHFPIGRFEVSGTSAPSALTVVAVAVVLNIAGQIGDLIESLIKRGAGVKDSGSILPGHGGILDRIDALLFAAPVLWLFLIARGLR